jgi:glucose-1-phosphate adenylyltransferase
MRRTLVLLLAGGVGSRLNVLVHRRAKPAVPFGSIYRIIDFTMTNIMHSGLERVGILTQYMPYSLTEHIGRGEHWGLVGRSRLAKILSPHTGQKDSDWYLGTADAVYRNLSFIHRTSPASVLILSGDHIYSMDYALLVATHLQTEADATLAVLEVPTEEAINFGTVLTDKNDRVTRFEEKPEKPKSNLVSMGIYVFSTKILLEELEEAIGRQGKTDFAADVFPLMLEKGRHLQAYRFQGYWQDVGTVRAYYDAHMDMLHPGSAIDLPAWRVRTNWDENRPGDRPPASFKPSSDVTSSIVARGCTIGGTVRDSVLSPGVIVEPGAVVERSILMHDVRVGAGAKVTEAVIDKQTRIGSEALVGGNGPSEPNARFPNHLDEGQVLIGKASQIPAGARIERNVILFPETLLPEGDEVRIRAGETIGEAEE